MPESVWSETVWKEINDAVLVEMGRVRTAQKIFPTLHFDNDPNVVPDELIDFANLSIEEGKTKPFVEIAATFTLTSQQVKQEPVQKTCKTLARMAAKALALAEDKYFFQFSKNGPRVQPGDRAQPPAPKLPANTSISNWRLAEDLGLLRAANPPNAGDDDSRVAKPLEVGRADGPNGDQWGNNTFARVAEAISLLVGKAQAGPYALVLPTEVYADAFIPPSKESLVTTAERIKPLTDGGFYTSPVLPAREGLLVALAGDPVTLFVGQEVKAEWVERQGNAFMFRVFERVQYVVRDPRALVLFTFKERP